MASLVDLLALRTQAQQAANMENDGLVTTAEWNSLINYGAKRMYSVLASKFGEEYAMSSATVAIVSGQDTYDLPADFYRMRGVDLSVSSRTVSCRRFQFRQRNMYSWSAINWGGSGNGRPMYMLSGSKIKFIPLPNVTGSVITLWYVPTMQVYVHGAGVLTSALLTNDDDTMDDVMGFSRLIVLEAAIQAKIKDDNDPAALLAQRAEVMEWIEREAKDRDEGEPMFVGTVDQPDDPGSLFGV